MHNLITLTNYKTRRALREGGKAATEAAAARVESSGAAAALPAVRRRGLARAGPMLASIAFRPGLRGSRPARCQGPLAARLRSAHADFQVSLQLPDLFGCLRRPAGAGERLCLPPSAPDPERRGQSAEFAWLTAADRRAVLEILLATKPGLPAEWQQYAQSKHIQPQSLHEGSNMSTSLVRSTIGILLAGAAGSRRGCRSQPNLWTDAGTRRSSTTAPRSRSVSTSPAPAPTLKARSTTAPARTNPPRARPSRTASSSSTSTTT